jgi:hypothetical protein
MPTKIKECTKQHLVDVALPSHGSTYTVISHKSVMDLSIQSLVDAGFQVNDEYYRCTRDGNIAQAVYRLTYMDDSELSMMFAWSNSYNKQMRFKCGIGAYINQTSSSMVCGDMGSWARKHTGSADTETEETIKDQIANAHMYYKQLVNDKNNMKEINITKRQQAQLLGILFAEHEILTTEQASIIRQQMSRPSFTYENADSLWAFYNHVTLALQQSHPKTWMEDQRILHWFISDAFKFNAVEVIEVDPNQVDLEDAIAEVEAENVKISPEQQEEWDQQTRIEEGLDHKGEESEAEEDVTVTEATEDEVADQLYGVNNDPEEVIGEFTPEITIEEQIAEDEAAVAEVCGEAPESVEEVSDHYDLPLGSDDMNSCPEVTDEEASELIKGQEAVDQQMAQEAAADNSVSDENIDDALKGEPNFDLDFTPIVEDNEDVNSDDVDFDFN